MISVRSAELEQHSPCLEKLVPVLQQATVDYFEDPSSTNELIVDIVEQYATGWVYSPELAAHSHEPRLELGLVGNGPDDTIGNFEDARVADMVEILKGAYGTLGVELAPDVSPETVVTNQFIDPAIGMP